ncbi:hypothetical protein BP6252_01354 [Coleophoma cylindrospora]|uniref:DUF2423 domain-containing protein n=1 Tax=Coleophoma cylindrospora TaxID=1849047 RepID=A0A3D8SSP9_9HELO|nr:hypothetical protein BP6252_01354 [Coleophoma cylindrospora]
MAKGARASTIKSNNAKLKSKVFGPVENARTERLSAKLLELAQQPKPSKVADLTLEAEDGASADDNVAPAAASKIADSMEVDSSVKVSTSTSKGRVEKRRSNRKAAIVFPKYKNGKRTGPKSKKQKIY